MKVSILLLGAFLVAIQTTIVIAEPQPGEPCAPSKGSAASSSSSAAASSGKSSSSSASAANAGSSKGGSAASSSSAAATKGNSAASSSSAAASKGSSAASSSSAAASKGSSVASSSSAATSKGNSAASSASAAASKGSSAASSASAAASKGSSAASSSSAAASKGNAAASSSSAAASKGNAAASSSSAAASKGSSAASSASAATSKGSSAASSSSAAASKGNAAASSSSAAASKGNAAASSSSAAASKGSSVASSASAATSKGSSAASSSSAAASKGNAAASSSSAAASKGNAAASSSSAAASKGSSAASGASAATSKGSSAASSSSAAASKGNAAASSSSAAASKGNAAASSSSAAASKGSSAASSASAAASKGSSAASSSSSAASKGGSAASSSSSSSSTSSSSSSASSASSSSTGKSGGSCAVKPKPTKSPKDCCGVNEEWSDCGKGPCEQPSCLNFGKPLKCASDGVCVAGCTCKKGFYRNKKNECVKPNKCENNVCPAMNEEISDCVSPCGETCATMGKDLICNFLVCNAGCDCKAGFFRNSTGSCVEPKNCDCPNNQFLDLCFNNCPPNTCDAIGKQFKCPAPDPNKCKPACTCYSWMKLNDEGVCVNVEDCPPKTCSKKHEVYSYQWWCFKEKCGSEDEPCPESFFEVPYQPVCTCKRPDYCRDANGDCVENTGTNRCPDPNTVYKECAKPTYYQTCVARGKDFGEVTWCERGCECLPGMYRNNKNKCVPEEECECPINEYFEECNWYRRPDSCEDIYTPYNVTYPIDKSACTPQCICDYGFYRNCDGKCVPIDQCPNYKCISSEEYNSCAGDYNCEECGDERCGRFIVEGGLARTSDAGASGAPQQVKSNGVLASMSADQNSAAEALRLIASSKQLGAAPAADPSAQKMGGSSAANPILAAATSAKELSASIRPPPSFSYLCTPKCLCKWNEYCRNSCGECIKNEGPESCPKENTQYSECRKQPWVQSCEVRGEKEISNDYCTKGCECKPGYYRNTTLACVAPENCECPVKEYYTCDDDCQAKTCEDLFKDYTGCYEKRDWNTWKCDYTCTCQYDHYRDCDGQCVKFTACPCPDPNAEMVECPYRCGGGTCDDPVIKTDCNNFCDWNKRLGCQCKAGYVRKSLSDPICIPLDECPCKKY